MHAVTLDAPGGPEVLQLREVPDLPPPGDGEVLIDVAATAVNRADLLQRAGAYAPPPGASDIIGMECSGTVAAVGAGVRLEVGTPVCALLAGGGYASQVLVPAGQVMPVPRGVDVVSAAALPEVAATVWSNLLGNPSDDFGLTAALADGETLLIHGGASGIGTMAIQLVRALRPHCLIAVTAGSADKLARCRELGADILINYKDEDFVAALRDATGGHGADVILDNMGAKYLARNLDVLAPDGRLVTIGMQGGTKAEVPIGAMLPKRLSYLTSTLRGRPVGQKSRICAGIVREVWPAVEDGRIRPIIEKVLPLADAAEAHRAMDAEAHVGKIVLQV
jgi:putative PIG3 family NAD(P)H quinone oxidoreductase